MTNPTTTKIKQIEARLAEIEKLKAEGGCQQHEKTVTIETSQTNSGYNLSGELNANGKAEVSTFIPRPMGEMAMNGQGHLDGYYGNQAQKDDKTETIIEGENCNTNVFTDLDDEVENLQKELAELKEGKREFDSIYNSLSAENPCTTNSDNDYVFTDRKTICRTDEQGNIDPNGKCLTTEHTVDYWPDPAKQTNCSGSMEKGALDVSQGDSTSQSTQYANINDKINALFDEVAEEEVKRQNEMSHDVAMKKDDDFGIG